jgi:hypothetical protein
MILLVSFPIFVSKGVEAQEVTSYEKSFAWDYDGKHWTWNLSIPVALYDAYKAVPVSTRTRQGPSGYGYLTTTQDYYVRALAEKLTKTTAELGYGSFDQVSFVLAFVQSLPYTSDSVTTQHDEYPRFPIETLVDDGGDCEDTSILFASLTLIMGYGTVYINPPDHYAVGILGNNLHGTYWTYPVDSNNSYYYCETTGDGFTIGQLPPEFMGQLASIYGIDETKQFVPDVVIEQPTVTPTPTDNPINPYPTDDAAPTVSGPTVQPVLPLSFNLISDNPALFIVIVLAIGGSVAVTVWSVRKPKVGDLPQSAVPNIPPTNPDVVENILADKYCIYCGAANKSYAAYCQSCGKQVPN